MVKTDFPRDGDFAPPTDYTDRSPLNTRERKELKKSTSKNLGDLSRELGGDFAKVTVLGTIKTFDKGYGLRIRDDNGDKIGTAYKGEQVRIFGRKKGVTDSEGKIRNFLKVGVYNNRGKIDEKRSGWVAEDFVEVDQNHINTLIQNLEKRIDKEKPKPEEKKSEPVDLEVKLIPEIRPPTSEIPEWVPSEPLAPLTIRDEKPEPKTPKITPKPPEPRVKLPELKPIVRMPESTKTEMNTEPVKPTTETTVKAPEARSSIHTIQNRDTIGEISRNISITPKEMMEASKPQVGTPLYITEPLAIPGANRLTPKTDTTPEKETPNTPIVKPKEKKAETAKSEVKPEEKKPETLKPEEKKPEVNPEPVKPQSINKKEEKPQPEPEKEIIKNSLGTVLEETTLNMLKKMSSNAKIAYQRMVGRARDLQCNFIIADKPYGMIYMFNQDGQSIARFPALYGRQTGDEIPHSAQGKTPDELTENEEISPAGIFVLSEMYFNEHMNTDLLDIGEDYDGDGYADYDDGTALHPLYLQKPWQKRPERIASKTPEDNKISKGCINVSEEAFDRWIRPCFANGGLIATTPDNQENLDTYIPPYISENNNMIAETSN